MTNGQALQKYMREENMPQLVFVAVVATSLISVVVTAVSGGLLGKTLVNWFGTYLSDLSSDLIGAWVMMVFMRFVMSRQPVEADEIIEPLEEMTTLEGEDVDTSIHEMQDVPATKPVIEVEHMVTELKKAATPEARQILIERVLQSGAGFRDLEMVDMELSNAKLDGADLQGANLTKTRLRSSTLRGADLRGANLYMSQLIECDLQKADLSGASLERTFMSGAKLQGARLVGTRIETSLWGVDLQNADLQNADLTGAELFRTDLRGANLSGITMTHAKINKETILPDGQYWDHRIDMTRYTNPEHPNFWRSDDPVSPARK